MTIGPYRLDVSYQHGRDLDEAIRKIVRRDDWASGCGFGERDLSFAFANSKARDKAKYAIQASGIAELTVRTWEDTGE